ncbi:MAG: xanthine dehydrogenase family protein subunit M [Chloroflexi bacterium]|nr:xanthine dehydrogenase family protein subunit M [Chloroflexota bacterium]
MHDFTFHTPRSLDEAFAMLEQYGEDARLIAGGTALVLLMKQRLAQPAHLVNLLGIPVLGRLEVTDGSLRAGATCSQRALEVSPAAQQGWPLLAETYRQVASVRIRNMATVGGGLAHADPNQDPPPSLIALGATVRVVSQKGERTLPVEALYKGYFETALETGEVVTEVVVPPAPSRSGGAFIKFLPRSADDYATISAAALLHLDSEGICREARIALGSAGPVPIRARRAEAALRGQRLTPALLREAAALVKEEVDPVEDVRGSAAYKRDMAAVIAQRALERALQRCGGQAQAQVRP